MLETISTGTTCTAPKNRFLRWLADPGANVTNEIRDILLGEMLATPAIVFAAMLNGLIVSVAALALHPGWLFVSFMLTDAAFVVARFATYFAARRATGAGRPYHMDVYLTVTIGWCLLQGCTTYAAMSLQNHALDITAIVSTIALIGPICVRNYAAPRYAILLITLIDFPTLVAILQSTEKLLWLIALQTPLFLVGSLATIKRFQKLSIEALTAHQESHHRARHDSLTNLLNRAGLTEALAVLNREPAQPFILFYLDLDGFKKVNDTFGHAAGDALLREVAARLKAQTRADDILARLGGDEFVIAAINLPPFEAANLANSIIRRIADHPFDLEGAQGVRVGVSIGFACTPQDAASLEDLHKNADAALYESKRAGRGICTRFVPDQRAAATTRPAKHASAA
jgi:diguanylate cyclase (GGDEF)-like protein